MLPEWTPAEYSTRWQRQIARGLEAGQSLSIHLGRDDLLLTQTQTLLALRSLAAARYDYTRPAVIAGGGSPLWIDALLSRRTSAHDREIAGLDVVYGGADAATVLASRALYADGTRPLRPTAYLRPPAGLPAAMVAPIAPRAEPTPIYNWANQPLWEIDRVQSIPEIVEKGEDWLAYLTIMLAVVLLLVALVISITP